MWWSTYWSNISCKTCTILLKTVFSEESNYSVCLICAKLKDLNNTSPCEKRHTCNTEMINNFKDI